mgnify:CR=1 FL=1
MSCKNIISQNDAGLQRLFNDLKNAKLFWSIVLISFQIGLALAVRIMQIELTDRAQKPTKWPNCPICGTRLRSKGLVSRMMHTIIGIVPWERRVGKCPNGCKIGQIAPLDQELGLESNQRTSNELKYFSCLLAVFVPFEIASILLKELIGIDVSHGAISNWVQEMGRAGIEKLKNELELLSNGQGSEPQVDSLFAKLPLILGADGVMVPFRQEGGSPKGRTVWREVKTGVIARIGKYLNTKGKSISRIAQKRLVAVLGSNDDLGVRLRLEAVRQGIKDAPLVAWISDGARGL